MCPRWIDFWNLFFNSVKVQMSSNPIKSSVRTVVKMLDSACCQQELVQPRGTSLRKHHRENLIPRYFLLFWQTLSFEAFRLDVGNTTATITITTTWITSCWIIFLDLKTSLRRNTHRFHLIKLHQTAELLHPVHISFACRYHFRVVLDVVFLRYMLRVRHEQEFLSPSLEAELQDRDHQGMLKDTTEGGVGFHRPNRRSVAESCE